MTDLTDRKLIGALIAQGLCAALGDYGPGRIIDPKELVDDALAIADELIARVDGAIS